MKLSLIIPIYNAELFLPRLFENIEAQGLFQDKEEIGEVIFVNDESHDRSAEIIEEYRKKHPNWVRIVSQKNQGQHIARNTGILVAKGDYIAFMDQDDALAVGGLTFLLDIITKENVDVARGGFKVVDDKEIEHWREFRDTADGYSIMNGEELLISTEGFSYFPQIWIALYKRTFLLEKKIMFDVQQYYLEDVVFNLNMALNTEKIAVVERVVYLYYFRESSVSHDRNRANRLRYDAGRGDLAIKYKLLYDEYQRNSMLKHSEQILPMWKTSYIWNNFNYWGLMLKIRGLRRSEINDRIKRFTEVGLFPMSHFYPNDLPKGYPNSMLFRIMWFLISFPKILKLMLYFRANPD